ncbi:uncharacterized protein LOC142230315 [Haematobia irritans]|uniref:uncharacterized protein LOC142230315 n=1 Tax=Haematobia irritans TaxID=7368 RepID=UPI003F4FA5EA
MSKEYLKIVYNTETKIWKSVNYPYGELKKLSLGEKFLKTMRSINPNKIIDYFYDANVSRTAKEVYEQSIVMAINLKEIGIKRGDIVIFFSMNNEWISALTFGCILMGAVPSFFEVHLDNESTGYLFNIAQPSLIVYEDKYLMKLQEILKTSQLQKTPLMLAINNGENPNIQEMLLKQPTTPIAYSDFKSIELFNTQEEIAILVLTSGSSGVPKLVQISHALLMHGVAIWWDNENNYAPLDGESVVFSFSPLRWISQGGVLFQSMLFGLKRVSSCGIPTGKYGLELLRNNDITHLFAAPSIFYEILLEIDPQDTQSLRTLKMVQLGGEPPSQILLDLAKKHAVNARIFNCYGMTEMSSCIAIDEHINGGKLLPGYELQILDDNLQPLGTNQPGQIALRPPYPLKGYMATENAQFLNDQGLFINGDYGVMDDEQRLHVLARYKDLIRSNGEVIIPNTLEYILINLPEIYVARLTSYQKSSNDTNEVGSLFVVLNANVSISHKEMSTKIMNTLSAHLNPRQLEVIKDIYYVESVPLTTCGKIDRIALKKLALSKAQM